MALSEKRVINTLKQFFINAIKIESDMNALGTTNYSDLRNEMTKKACSSRGIGEDLRKLREEAGLMQTEACRLSGVPLTTWQSWERDPSLPSATSPPAIAFSWLALYMKYQELVEFFPKRRRIGTKTQLRQEGEQL